MDTLTTAEQEELLVAEALRDRKNGFEGIVNRYWGVVKGFLRFLGAPEADLEDLIQETFIKIYGNLEKFDRQRSLSTWMLSIARNTFYDDARSRTRAKRTETQRERTETITTPEEQAINRLTAEEFLGNLSEEDRLIVELKMFLDLSFPQMAELLEMTENALRVRLHRIIRRFRPEERGEGHET